MGENCSEKKLKCQTSEPHLFVLKLLNSKGVGHARLKWYEHASLVYFFLLISNE